MTYSNETPTDSPDPYAAAPHESMPLQSMRVAMAAYLAQLPMLARGSWSHIAKARTMLRTLFKAEREAFAAWVLSVLRGNAAWQERVIDDLGGHQALRRWERRQRLSSAPESHTAPEPKAYSQPLQSTAAQTPRAKRRGTSRTTDRLGLFRLASISSGRVAMRSGSARGRRTGGHRPAWNFDIKPIAITPGDLRGGRARSSESAESRNPEKLWLDICQQVALWDNQITAAMTEVLCSSEPSKSGANAKAPP